MEQITWTDEFSVNHRLFDSQHQNIIRLINMLINSQQTHVRSEIISDTLYDMRKYSLSHFKDEEKFLSENDFPDLTKHNQLHKEFRKKTARFSVSTTLHEEAIPETLLIYLKEWWVHHILVEDMQYKTYFADIECSGVEISGTENQIRAQQELTRHTI